jgi:hypothetical protein
MGRAGWSSTGNQFLNDSPSPSQTWWDETGGTALEKLLVVDPVLADLVAIKWLTAHAAKHALLLRDIDEYNTAALSLLGTFTHGYVYVWTQVGTQAFALKCACGKTRVGMAYFWSDAEQTYFIGCQCGRHYAIYADTTIRLVEYTELLPMTDPSVEVDPESLCHFEEKFLSNQRGRMN